MDDVFLTAFVEEIVAHARFEGDPSRKKLEYYRNRMESVCKLFNNLGLVKKCEESAIGWRSTPALVKLAVRRLCRARLEREIDCDYLDPVPFERAMAFNLIMENLFGDCTIERHVADVALETLGLISEVDDSYRPSRLLMRLFRDNYWASDSDSEPSEVAPKLANS